MESRFCSCWIHFWMVLVLFKNISGDPTPPPHYTVHLTNAGFEQAVQACSPGVLTTLATKQEVANILQLISDQALPHIQNDLSFWVGLKKVKNECVVPTQPLRGFKWTEDSSTETQVIPWMVEPERTCTTVRCAALKVEPEGSRISRWGLIPVKCTLKKPFICKLTGGKPKPVTPGPEPVTAGTRPADVEPSTPEPKTVAQTPEPTTAGPGLTTPGSKPEANLKPQVESDPQEPELDPDRASGPVLSSDFCQPPIITNARYITLDPDNSSRIQVECWSKGPRVQLELHCAGRPAVWRLLDDSPANFTAICQPCESGFQKDATGNCVDVDECSAGDAPCRHTCLNTEGSFRCVCSDENGKEQDEDSSVCDDTPANSDNGLQSSEILIPALGAVAALLVLVLVVAVTVRCCLMRRSKKRAIKKAEKMAMKSKEGSQAH